MLKLLLPYLFAVLGASGIVIQNYLNSSALKNYGIFPIILVTYISGLVCAVIYILFSGELKTVLDSGFPWFKLILSGFFGTIVVIFIPKSFFLMGPSSTLTIVIVTQLLLGIVLELSLGNNNLSVLKITGIATCLLGSLMVVKG